MRETSARPNPCSERERLRRMLANEADMSFKRRAEAVFDFLSVQPGDRVLDVGCGRGFYLNLLAELEPRCDVVGIELDRRLLDVARARLAGVRVAAASAYHIPLGTGTIDKVIFTEVLEHIPDDRAALTEIARVMAPGGVLALTTPHADYPFLWDPINKVLEATLGTHIRTGPLAGVWANHIRLYTPEGLARLVAGVGLHIVETRFLVRHCFPFSHNLVYGLGKPLLERGLLPESLSSAADRFAVAPEAGSRLNPVRFGVVLFSWVDRLNDVLPATSDRPFLLIALKASKPEQEP